MRRQEEYALLSAPRECDITSPCRAEREALDLPIGKFREGFMCQYVVSGVSVNRHFQPDSIQDFPGRCGMEHVIRSTGEIP